ncbi:MAG: hypothetical protein HOO67_04110 [Candidatus Peribacteraceae bacterium]|nr:hypothetical protein [Candidatus Peribacteraceae bacterium]
MPIPSAIHRYFWDADLRVLDSQEHKQYIADRLLDKGDVEAARWLVKTYPREHLIHRVRASRQLSPKSRNFWMLYLGIPTATDA